MSQQFIIYGDMSSREFTDPVGSPVDPPQLYQGDEYVFALRLLDKLDGSTSRLVYPNVRSLSASIGNVQSAPTGGFITLKFGVNGTPSERLALNLDAATFKRILGATPGAQPYGLQEVYNPVAGCWMLRFGYGSNVPLMLASNMLEPESFCRINQFLKDGQRWIEIRNLQAPIASTSVSARTLIDGPSIQRIRSGYTTFDGINQIKVSEIQALRVPTGWTGTFSLKYGGLVTKYFSNSSSSDDYATGLNTLFNDAVIRFSVTNPEPEMAYIEFIGPLLGLPQDLLVITIGQTTPGDLTFTISTDTAEVSAALRANPKGFNSTMEVEIEVAGDNDSPDVPGRRFILFQVPVNILPQLQWSGMEAAASIDWLTPPNPTDSIPFTRDQIITGVQFYTQQFGDGVHTSFDFQHNLNTENIASVAIRQNIEGGSILNDDDYTVVIRSPNLVTVTFPSPPSDLSLAVVIASAGPASAFQAHTHTIAQIIGLQDVLDSILARLTAIENQLPHNILPPGTSIFGVSPNQVVTFEIDDQWDVIPSNRIPDKFDPTKLPPRGVLLPAVHSAIELGPFMVDPSADTITLINPPTLNQSDALADGYGQRVHIDTPQFFSLANCTFDSTLNVVNCAGHGLTNGRRVKFVSILTLPAALSPFVVYYVVGATTNTFQVSIMPNGVALPLLDPGTGISTIWTILDLPGGLPGSTDYYALVPSPTECMQAPQVSGNSDAYKTIVAAPAFWLTFDLLYNIPTLNYWSGSGRSGDLVQIISPDASYYGLFIQGGAYYWESDTSEGTGPGPAPVANTWITCEIHGNGTTREIYIGGSLVFTGTVTGSSISIFKIGQIDGNNSPVSFAYFKNVKAGTTRGGTDIFSDNFSSGDLSAWTGTDGSAAVVDTGVALNRFQVAIDAPGGNPVDITSTGAGPPPTISTIRDAPTPLTDPNAINPNQAYSVRGSIPLRALVGIPSETLEVTDIVASTGTYLYHIVRSDVPGTNSFYPYAMEREIFRLAVNDTMLAPGSVFTCVFNIGLRMYKQSTNAQYLLVIEVADLPEVTTPFPTGPNLLEVEWNKTPLLQQRIIITDTLITHTFGAQVINTTAGVIQANKKLYGVEMAGDVAPSSANFALRCRLIEFDTEDNVSDATGLIYFTLTNAQAVVISTVTSTS